jgi:hypothetical protein
MDAMSSSESAHRAVSASITTTHLLLHTQVQWCCHRPACDMLLGPLSKAPRPPCPLSGAVATPDRTHIPAAPTYTWSHPCPDPSTTLSWHCLPPHAPSTPLTTSLRTSPECPTPRLRAGSIPGTLRTLVRSPHCSWSAIWLAPCPGPYQLYGRQFRLDPFDPRDPAPHRHALRSSHHRRAGTPTIR